MKFDSSQFTGKENKEESSENSHRIKLAKSSIFGLEYKDSLSGKP
jgi:hypothetical protein